MPERPAWVPLQPLLTAAEPQETRALLVLSVQQGGPGTALVAGAWKASSAACVAREVAAHCPRSPHGGGHREDRGTACL